MIIEVKYEASRGTNYETFDTEDYFGYTDEQWGALSEDERDAILMEAVENNQPYWMVSSVTKQD